MPLTSKGYKVKNSGKLKNVDKCFYGHLTHASLQKQEDAVEVIGNPGNMGLPERYSRK